MKRSLTRPTAALLLVLTLGAFTPVSSGESLPTLKFACSTPETGAIEDAFTMTLDNLIGINSIPYDPNKWNDTGLLETAADSRFLRAAPSYGDNPWVHDGAYNTWSAMNLTSTIPVPEATPQFSSGRLRQSCLSAMVIRL